MPSTLLTFDILRLAQPTDTLTRSVLMTSITYTTSFVFSPPLPKRDLGAARRWHPFCHGSGHPLTLCLQHSKILVPTSLRHSAYTEL